MAELELLYNNAPVWATITGVIQQSNEFELEAQPSLIGGVTGKRYNLKISYSNEQVYVSEKTIGTLLPKGCPERHINRNGTFCLGLDAGKKIKTANNATEWWNFLEEYLQCQQVVDKRKTWPADRWLSHGQAAIYHKKLEEEAKKFGLEEDVSNALNYKVGWLAGELPVYWSKSNKPCIRYRAPCPLGCSKNGKPLRVRHCEHKTQLPLIVEYEMMRRDLEKKFVAEHKSKGFKCCGTMNDCPFNDRSHNERR